MSERHSDYNLPYTNIFGKLPSVHQNALTDAITETSFSRFYTKPEVQRIIGTIGRNKNNQTPNQIKEDNVYDQAFQLQPIITDNASTVQKVTTYKDIVRMCNRLGINTDKADVWQATDQFNYAMPVNIDKLLNYNEYFWIGEEEPQYIAIENIQNKVQTKLIQMVKHYLNNGVRLTVWNEIKQLLNIVYSVIPLNKRIFVPDLTLVIEDTANHPPYVFTAIPNPQDYTLKNAWELQNNWFHRSDIWDISIVKQAKLPIIEYNSSIQMTEWTYTKINWKYRKSAAYPWEAVNEGPSRDELFKRFAMIASSATNDTFTIAGNQVATFVPGFKFIIEDSPIFNSNWTVQSSSLVGGNTVIRVTTNVISNTPSGTIIPFTKTSKGDGWNGLHEHWLYVGAEAPVPTIPRTDIASVSTNHITIVATAGQTLFSMGAQYIRGDNVLRVYVNGVRQYASYAEEPLFKVRFYEGLNAGDVVSIYAFAMTDSDFNKELVRVRTSETDLVLEYKCLVEYRIQEQIKTKSNQYPLFDLVASDGSPIGKMSTIVEYTESSDAPVNQLVDKRIVIGPNKDYKYSIGLVNPNGTLNYFYDKVDGVVSVWRKNDVESYVPKRVDSERQESTASDAVLEIPASFMNNVHHEARSTLSHSEIFLHYKSIMDSQPMVDPAIYGTFLTSSGSYRLLDRPNYGLGGTIKEYNYGMDNFISSLVSSKYSPIDIIDFASSQCSETLVSLREYVEENILAAVGSNDPLAAADTARFLAEGFLLQLSNDTIATRAYGDSSVSLKGDILNWIATIPYIGLGKRVEPILLEDQRLNILELTHHDGHKNLSEINNKTITKAKLNLIKSLGLYPNNVPQPKPTNPNAGQLWYDAASDKLYRFNASYVGNTAPEDLGIDNIYWMNTANSSIYKKINGVWIATSITQNDLWIVFDFKKLVLDVILFVEKLLYAGAPDTNTTVLDPILPLFDANNQEYQSAMKKEFLDYCINANIKTPFTSNYVASDPFTWNYTLINVGGVTGIAKWYDIYTALYNTQYPHLKPWRLQGYINKPTWWDEEYVFTNTFARRWNPIMWTNIKSGIVPAGRPLPSGIISTGAVNAVTPVLKTSVNTSNVTTPDGIEPDGLFPPYWVSTGVAPVDVLLSPTIGSAQDQYILDNTKNHDYPFGTNGPNEARWKKGIHYMYARLRSMFRVEPIKFMHYAFGIEYKEVGGLIINKETDAVQSHRDMIFHGDTDASGTPRYYHGLNQWYVQFFRYNALDLNGSEFKRSWNTWNTYLGYDVGSFVIDKTLSITSPLFEITPNDYSIAIKHAEQVRNVWVDALYVNVQQIGSRRELPLGSGRDWKFGVSTRSPVSTQYEYYGVKKYRISANTTNNTFDLIEGTMTLAGWETGDSIVFDTGVNGILPGGVDDQNYFFLIKVSDTKFMIATSKVDALAGNNVILNYAGTGVFYVAELQSTFYALEMKNSPVLWKHYAINKNDVKTFLNGLVITGIQNLIDVIDGYAEMLKDHGFVFNDPSVPEYDASNSRLINWQFLTEDMIDQFYIRTSSSSGTKIDQLGTIELNPFSNNLWIKHPVGIVSEFNESDIHNVQNAAVMYDKNGDKINTRYYHVLRKDGITQFSTTDQELNSTQTNEAISSSIDPTGFSGGHIYFDEYDQVILFNHYTISNSLLYDSFLGIAIPKVNAYFEKQSNSTKRPNVGGFVLSNGKLKQNFEYTTGNILKYYDTFTVNENADFVNYARGVLGYVPNASYLVGTNTTPKSQFLFYKGMIKAKGTMGSIDAFTNSRHFLASTIDEFWAYRSFDFGDSRTNVSYRIKMIPEDTTRSHTKFEFVGNVGTAVERFFTKISTDDTTRWTNFPSQFLKLDNALSLFELKPNEMFTVLPFNKTINGVTKSLIDHKSCDGIALFRDNPTRKMTTTAGNSGIINTGIEYIRDANTLDVYLNGTKLTVGVDYTELTTSTIKLITTFTAIDVVVITWNRSILKEDVHYKRINSRTIELLLSDTRYLILITYIGAYDKFAPIKVYDNKSNTTLYDIMPWDPIDNLHHSVLATHVDIFNPWDLAIYNENPISKEVPNFWCNETVGKLWCNTSSFKYINYKDLTLSTNEKLVNWGKVEEWSDPAIYQWTESTIHPDLWDNRAGTEGVTGTTYKVVYKRTRSQFNGTIVGNKINTTTPHNFIIGDEISVYTEGELPSGLESNTMYVVSNVTPTTISIKNQDGNPVTIYPTGVGGFVVFKSHYDDNWFTVEQKIQSWDAYNVNFTTNTLITTMAPNEEYSLYVNGTYMQDGVMPADSVIVLEDEVIDLVSANPLAYTITILNKIGAVDGFEDVRPENLDFGNSTYQAYVGTPHSVVPFINEVTGIYEPKYCFWVRSKQNPINDRTSLTTTTLEGLLVRNDSPYLLCLKPTGELSQHYKQLVIAGISGSISDEDRYDLRINENHTLRDNLRNETGSMLKSVHSEWVMFREKQKETIDLALWNMVTESILGYSLLDRSVAVPATDRVVFDDVNKTNTRYGMERGQAFVPGDQALETILTVLNSPEIDYTPIDIDYFIQTHPIDTKPQLETFLHDLYFTLPSEHVNRLFFAVMMDALTNINVDYSASLMKTSAISISGVAPLNVNGEFDD